MASKKVDIKYVRTHPNVSFEAVLNHYGLEMVSAGSNPAQKKVLCPFHDDTDPSCNINLEKRVFHCFACDEKGNVLDFVMKIEELDARNGAIKLAEICGVETVENAGTKATKKKAMTPKERLAARKSGGMSPAEAVSPADEDAEASDEAEPVAKPETKSASSEFVPYERELTLDPYHPYLKERVSDEIIEEFGLGYCKAGFQRGRIAIRLHDPAGYPLGYAGRWAEAEPPEGTPRYLLPKHFPKEQVLFNVHRLPTPCMEVVLVESYWSVFHLWDLGYPVVALMGCALSSYHVTILKERGVERVTVLFDGDDAGRKGSAGAVEALVKSFFVSAPSVEDGFKPHKANREELNRLLKDVPRSIKMLRETVAS